MQRWHVTAVLLAAAVGTVAVVPTLSSRLSGAPPVVPPTEVTSTPPPELVETLVNPPAGLAAGHLELDVGFDRSAVLKGQRTERFVTLTLTAPDNLGENFRRPVDLAVVMDASGSMSGRGKIDYAKRAAKLLATSMEQDDTYSFVTFSDDATTVVPATAVYEPKAIHQAIDRVLEGGGTNIYAGLQKGASEVKRSVRPEQVGRLVLLSDGKATAGITDPVALERFVSTLASSGVTVSAVGLGLEYNEDLMSRLADVGGGTYDFVDDPKELSKVFTDELDRTAAVVARDVRVRVTVPEGVELLDVIGWDAERDAEGWSVRIGDVYAGNSTKVVARVAIDGSRAVTGIGATATATYDDLVHGDQREERDEAVLDVTNSSQTVATSVNRDRAASASRAWGNWHLEKSARAYQSGEVDKAKDLITASNAILHDASIEFDDAELQEDAENSLHQKQVYEAHAPASTEGRRAIKAGKEYANFATR